MTIFGYLLVLFPPTRWLLERLAFWTCLLVIWGNYT